MCSHPRDKLEYVIAFEIIYDKDFAEWIISLDADVRRAIVAYEAPLREYGPQLGRTRVDTVKGSAYPNMKELRVQHRGIPWRILFAFDPIRRAIFLVGGDKTGDKRWYKTNIPIADERFKRLLDALEVEKDDP